MLNRQKYARTPKKSKICMLHARAYFYLPWSSGTKWAAEKADLIGQIIKLKKSQQVLFFKCEELTNENKKLKVELCDLKNENEQLKFENSTSNDLIKENKKLLAKLNQLRRSSNANVTPNKSPRKPLQEILRKSLKNPIQETSVTLKEKSTEYEVAKLLKHRGKIGKREFLV